MFQNPFVACTQKETNEEQTCLLNALQQAIDVDGLQVGV